VNPALYRSAMRLWAGTVGVAALSWAGACGGSGGAPPDAGPLVDAHVVDTSVDRKQDASENYCICDLTTSGELLDPQGCGPNYCSVGVPHDEGGNQCDYGLVCCAPCVDASSADAPSDVAAEANSD
jgi:hypothetical protein